MIEEFFVFLIVIFGIAMIVVLSSKRRSKRYRKEVMDMYVAAKTRFLAKEDKLDLEEETKTFKSWLKKEKTKEGNFELDDAIEEELIERVSEPKKK